MEKIEKEIKILISENKFNDLVNQILWDFDDIQYNYYYDDHNYSLLKQDITLRVRKKKKELFLQIKLPIHKDNFFTKKREYTFPIATLSANIIYKELKDKHIELVLNSELKNLGVLKTRRRKYIINNKLQLNLDENSYLGIKDYEIEIEFEKDSELKEIKELLFHLGIELTNEMKGKRTRFFNQFCSKNSLNE